MTDDDHLTSDESPSLREQAESRLRQQRESTRHPRSEQDTENLIHELQVHQVELELQNEELIRTQTDLRESQRRYFDLYNVAPVGYLILTKTGVIQEANLTVCNLLQHPHQYVIGRALSLYCTPESRPDFYLYLQRFETSDSPQELDIILQPHNDSQNLRHVHLVGEKNIDRTGQVTYWIVINDKTDQIHAEQSLVATEKRFRAVFEASPVALALTRFSDGKMFQVNPPFLTLFGYSHINEITQQISTDFYGEPEQRSHLMARLQREGVITNHEMPIVRKDGSNRWVSLSMRLTELDGERVIITGLVDLTEEREMRAKIEATDRRYRELLEETNQKLEAQVQQRTAELTVANDLLRQRQITLQTLTDHASDVICLHDPDGTYRYVSPSVKRLMGYDPEALIGRNAFELLHPDDREQALAGTQRLLANSESTGVLTHRAKTASGDYIWVEVAGRLVVNEHGVPAHLVTVSRDMTEHKRLEADLRDALDKEVELNQLRSRFLSMVSHDFRTPLTAIMTTASILQRYQDRFSPAERVERLTRVQSLVQYMDKMLDDVSYIGKAQTGDIPFEPVDTDFAELCRDIISDVEIAYGAPDKIRMVLLGRCELVCIDRRLLHKILINLLSNAVKYTPGDGLVTFTATCEPYLIAITIQDSGIGIPKIDQLKLFETFHRAANVGSIEGTGLGLAIVKQSVLRHGGSITFRSEEGKGTTFQVKLPQAR